MSDLLINRADNEIATLVLAHGAGAGKQSDFMEDMARLLSTQGISVIRFDFPYMQTITQTGKRRPPDKSDKLQAYYSDILTDVNKDASLPLFIGGKSMGGRIATLILSSSPAQGACVFGYPFHPPGKPEKLRTDHLIDMDKPILINQGERDTFGTLSEIESYSLSKKIEMHFLTDGDHSLKPRKSSGFSLDGHLQQAALQTASFINRQISC